MSVSTSEFRGALAHLAGGVVVVTTREDDGIDRGMTATAVCSVSLDPPLVMACMSHETATYRAVQSSGVFALNILPASADGLAGRFATDRDDKFDGVETTAGETGAPILARALAYCDCAVESAVAAGDHTIFIGRVLQAASPDEHHLPLLYYRGEYGSIVPLDPSEAAEGSE